MSIYRPIVRTHPRRTQSSRLSEGNQSSKRTPNTGNRIAEPSSSQMEKKDKPQPSSPSTTVSSFRALRVSEVYCPTCKTAKPVEEVLGYEGEGVSVFHVVCQHCNSVVGQRTVTEAS